MNHAESGAKNFPAVIALAMIGITGALAFFVLSLLGVLPALWGYGALVAVPFLCATLIVGTVGKRSPHDDPPNPMKSFGAGGRS